METNRESAVVGSFSGWGMAVGLETVKDELGGKGVCVDRGRVEPGMLHRGLGSSIVRGEVTRAERVGVSLEFWIFPVSCEAGQ